MKNSAADYICPTMLYSFDAMSLLSKLIGRDVRPESFINFVQAYNLDPYICSKRLCFYLQSFRRTEKLSRTQLDAIFGEVACSSPIVSLSRDEEMMVLTQDDLEIEFCRGTYQRVLHCPVYYDSKRFCLLSLSFNELEGINTKGELVRWRSPTLLSNLFEPFFQHADIQKLAKEINKEAAGDKKPKLKKYQIARPLILKTIKKLGHDPKALPDSSTGGAGVKKLVREELKAHHIFEKLTSFDNHWSDMLKDEDLIEVYK